MICSRQATVCLAAALLLGLPAIGPRPVLAAPSRSATLNAEAATHSVARKMRQSRKKPARPAAPPTVVKDLRVMAYPDHTRLVLVLQRDVTFTQNRQRNPDRLIIELQNALLGTAAKTVLSDKEFPQEIAIAQRHPRSVTVSLNMAAISDYKLLPLTRPSRLVVDVYPRMDIGTVRSPAGASPPTVASLPQPRSAKRPVRPEIKTIVLDPGHGGKDPGAIGRTGIAEKDIVLKVGLKLRELITKQLGNHVLMTRHQDMFVDLEDRAKFANATEADLFISIHVNSHPQRSTKGLEVYHFGEASDQRALEVAARENGTPIKDTGIGWQYFVADLLTTKKVEESLELAWTTKQAMVTHLDSHYDVVDHGVKTGPFYVLRYTAMPSILAEIAFISNPTE
ncbi:MAG: N-acetylmuramoyl-L-alanine amidase, partial [Nitrospiraceae bacterium]